MSVAANVKHAEGSKGWFVQSLEDAARSSIIENAGQNALSEAHLQDALKAVRSQGETLFSKLPKSADKTVMLDEARRVVSNGAIAFGSENVAEDVSLFKDLLKSITPEAIIHKLDSAKPDELGTMVDVATPHGVVRQFVRPATESEFRRSVSSSGSHTVANPSLEGKLGAGLSLVFAAMAAYNAYGYLSHSVQPEMVSDGQGGAKVENKVQWSNATFGVVNAGVAGVLGYMGINGAKTSELFGKAAHR